MSHNYQGILNNGDSIGLRKARRILLATTWRSGSTFLGDLLSRYPGVFYSFEASLKSIDDKLMYTGTTSKVQSE